MALTIAFDKATYDRGDTMTATVTATSPDSFAVSWGDTRSPGATVDSGLRVRAATDLSWDDPDREWSQKSRTATVLTLEAVA